MLYAKGIPHSDIDINEVIKEIYTPVGEHNYFNITNVAVCEGKWYNKQTACIIGHKKYINLTVSGYIPHSFYITSPEDSEEKTNIEGNNINFTFIGVKVVQEKRFDTTHNEVINIPFLYISNSTGLWHFLRNLLYTTDESSIYISVRELYEYLTHRKVELKAENHTIVDKGTTVSHFELTAHHPKGSACDGEEVEQTISE